MSTFLQNVANQLQNAPADIVVFDMMKQWVQHTEKQFVFGLLENGSVDLIIQERSSNVTSVFREVAFEASNSLNTSSYCRGVRVGATDIHSHCQ